jgi:hypothetical protein
VFFAGILCHVNQTYAATYYVDPNSDNGCNGAGQGTTLNLSGEMLTDGGVESWTSSTTLTNWTKSASGSSSLNQDLISPYAGSYSARIDIDGSTSNVFIYQGTTALMTAGNRYRLSFYAKGTSAFAIQPGYRGSSFVVIANPTVTTSWTRYEYVFSPTQNSRIEIGRQSGQGANQSFYIDSVSLVEVIGGCAWSGTSKITGLAAGDNVNFKRGEIFRGNTFNIPASGTNGNPVTFDAYGSGAKPVLTKLIDYSNSAGFSWVDGGTGDSLVLKLAGTITDPLLSPWGVLNGGHPEFNFLTNGSFETWSGSNPTSWATSTSGTSVVNHVTIGAYTTDGGTNSISLTPDASNSDVSVSQSVTLSADTVYAFRVVHKETGSAIPIVRVKKTSGGNSYWNFATAIWQDDITTKSLVNRSSYYDSWMYFKTPVGSSATYEILLGNGANSASQTLYFDQVIVMEKKQLNNNFMVATAPNSSWATSKFSSLSSRETGLSAGSLNPGEWYWEDEILYYHLANGENSAANTHVEVAQGKWTSGNVDGIVNEGKNYINISNLEAAYFQRYLISINASFVTIKNVYSHHGDMAYLTYGSTNSVYFYNDIGANTFEHSFYDMGSNGSRYWNCVIYKTQTDNGVNLYPAVRNVSIKNFIASNVDTDAFSMTNAPFIQGVADHLLYDGNILNGWPVSGMDDVVADPLFTNPFWSDFSLQSLSPAIDAGTTTSIMIATTTDIIGNPIYGTPDIGAYEYQPPFALGTSLIDPTGNIRIYGDRMYRYTTATSSTMSANFLVAPAEGTWTYSASTTRPEWLNISNITWGTTKQWTASSSMATTTVYTIGDLTPNATYTISVDGAASTSLTSSCSNDICTADSNGKLILTYTGGYSTHTFAVTPYTAPTPTPTPTVSSGGSSGSSGSSGGYYIRPPTSPTPTPAAVSTTTCNIIMYPLIIKNIQEGSVGTDVLLLKKILGLEGLLTSTTATYGASTTKAVSSFQSKYGIVSSGTPETTGYGSVGPKTRAFLNKMISDGKYPTLKQCLTNAYSNNVSTPTASIANGSTTNLSATTSASKAASSITASFTRSLTLGSTGEDVRSLQIFLNTHGFVVSSTGAGSLGNETNYFGPATKAALIKFQNANADLILKPQGLTEGTGFFGEGTRKVVNGMGR